MPLTPQYTWLQDDSALTLKVSLSSAAGVTRNTRVECTDAMVKITCPPYFLQVALFSCVVLRRHAGSDAVCNCPLRGRRAGAAAAVAVS
jgi:hypothetical protein